MGEAKFIFMKVSQVVTLMRGPVEGNPVTSADSAHEDNESV